MAKPIKSLEVYYPMIQFLMICYYCCCCWFYCHHHHYHKITIVIITTFVEYTLVIINKCIFLKAFSGLFQLNNLSNLIPSLIACELAVDSSSNWRLHVQLLEKFSCFPKCLTSEQIYYKFVPLFFRLLSSNVS